MRRRLRRSDSSLRSRTAVVLLAATSALAACGGGGTAASQGQIEITKSPDDLASATTTTVPSDDDGETTVQTYRQPPALPEGSGCTTTESDGLPTGRWFGYLIEVNANTFTFDLACRFTSTQAAIAAEEDGEFLEAGEAVYIRNLVADRRIVETNPGISINEFDEDGEDVPSGAFYPQWYVSAPTGIPVWVTMDPTRVRTLTLQVEN